MGWAEKQNAACGTWIVVILFVIAQVSPGQILHRSPDAPTAPSQDKTSEESTSAVVIPPDMLFQPRPKRVPVDLEDSTACYRDLAEMSQFPAAHYLDNEEVSRLDPYAVGWAPWEQLPWRLLDVAARMDHLSQSSDPGFRKLVHDAYSVQLDSTHLNWADRDFGFTQQWFQAVSTRLAVNSFFQIGAQVMSEDPDGEQTSGYYDDSGTYHETRTVSAAQEEEVQRSADLLMSHIEEDAAAVRAELALRQTKSLTFAGLRDVLRQRLAGLWANQLLPALMQTAGSTSDRPLLAITRPVVTVKGHGSFQRYPWTNLLGWGEQYEPVNLSPADGKALHHVAVSVIFKDADGDVEPWYAYMDELTSEKPVGVVIDGAFSKFFVDLSPGITATLSVYCDEGRNENVPVNLPPRYVEKASANSPQADLTAIRNNALQVDRQAAADSDKLFDTLDKFYPPVENPERYRKLLVQCVEPNVDYSLTDKNGQLTTPSQIRLEPFGASASTVTALITESTAHGPKAHPYTGVFYETPEHGTVICLVGSQAQVQADDFISGRLRFVISHRGVVDYRDYVPDAQARCRFPRYVIFIDENQRPAMELLSDQSRHISTVSMIDPEAPQQVRQNAVDPSPINGRKVPLRPPSASNAPDPATAQTEAQQIVQLLDNFSAANPGLIGPDVHAQLWHDLQKLRNTANTLTKADPNDPSIVQSIEHFNSALSAAITRGRTVSQRSNDSQFAAPMSELVGNLQAVRDSSTSDQGN
jgi:hypothetical protein